MSDEAEQAGLDEVVEEYAEEGEQEKAERTAPDLPENIPADWKVKTVEGVKQDLLGGGTPSKGNDEYWNGEIPWASVKDLDSITLSDTEDHITEKGLEESAANLIPSNSIVISTRMTVGEPFINKTKMAINQDMKGISPNSELVNTYYLAYNLRRKDPYLKSLGRGTTVDGITTSDLERTHVELPPLPEQRKIASVLYNVDEAIQKTEEIIEQTKRLEKGAIQSVLSDGTKDRTAKKHTPIGEIPEEWEVKQVKELTDVTVGYVQTIDGHFTNSGNGVRLFRTQDISSRGLQTDEEIYVTREFHEDNKGSQVEPGDLIVSRHGDSGQAAVVPDSLDEAHSQNVVVIRSSDSFVSEFLEYLFNYETTRQRLLAWKAGSVQKVVSTTAVQNFRIPLPPIDEQKEIIENLSSMRGRLENEQGYLNRLHRLKRALMQDLLTGEVRTNDRAIEVLPEVEAHG